MSQTISNSIFLVAIVFISCVRTASYHRGKVKCSEVPSNILSKSLGPAFNSRYMSVGEPNFLEVNARESSSPKRTAGNSDLPFYVDDHFTEEISDTPAWKTNHFITKRDLQLRKNVQKRAVKPVRQWECEAKIRWQDLGPGYYPRYLRTVECISSECWYGMFTCKPRSFTVKILRRKDRCVEDNGFKVGNAGRPSELKELWVWEERAINFCCNCASQ